MTRGGVPAQKSPQNSRTQWLFTNAWNWADDESLGSVYSCADVQPNMHCWKHIQFGETSCILYILLK